MTYMAFASKQAPVVVDPDHPSLHHRGLERLAMKN